MNEDKFNKWKEANQWLFQALKDRVQDLNNDLMEAALGAAQAPEDRFREVRRQVAVRTGEIVAIGELAEMNFAFYEELTGEEE